MWGGARADIAGLRVRSGTRRWTRRTSRGCSALAAGWASRSKCVRARCTRSTTSDPASIGRAGTRTSTCATAYWSTRATHLRCARWNMAHSHSRDAMRCGAVVCSSVPACSLSLSLSLFLFLSLLSPSFQRSFAPKTFLAHRILLYTVLNVQYLRVFGQLDYCTDFQLALYSDFLFELFDTDNYIFVNLQQNLSLFADA